MEKDYKNSVLEPVSVFSLLMEISNLNMVCKTNIGNNIVYITDYMVSPNLMQEIGRLREISFRSMCAGTGKEVDIDEYDISSTPFQQMFVWDPENNEIVGAYRFIVMNELIGDSPTSHLFHLQPNFHKSIKPYAIELGRSFVNFQAKKARYALHNLWDGLSFLTIKYPDIKYFFGKVTLYPWILDDKLDILLSFMSEMFPSDNSVFPKSPVNFSKVNDFIKTIGFEENKKLLVRRFKEGERKTIPPLVNAYMKLSETMKYLGASVNAKFGHVIEGCILVTIADINPEVIREHTKQLF
jgi:hypothetical protein